MKLGNILSPGILALGMSFAVTAGSMYVTVNAASNSAVLQPTAEATLTKVIAGSESVLSSVTVQLAADGSLNGRFSSIDASSGELAPADEVKVSLVSSVAPSMDTTTNADGTFSFGNVTPGIYAIHADSDKGRLAYAIRVIASTEPAAERNAVEPVSLAMDLQMDFGLTPSRDNSALSELISAVRPDTGKSANDDAAEIVEAPAPRQVTKTGYEVRLANNSIGHEQLRLKADGSLDGHVTLLNPDSGNIAAINDLTVSFIRDNQIVNSTPVSVDGTFTQQDLTPGVYTLVVAGTDGISYLGVDIVAAEGTSDFTPTAIRKQETFDVGVLQDGPVEFVDEGFASDDDDDGGFFPGDGGGGGFGPGGGGEGLFGGGILPWLAIGGAAWALADDGDTVVSPGI